MASTTRPPVTDTEREVLLDLANALHKENEKSVFFCNGTIQGVEIGQPILFCCLEEGGGNARAIRITQDPESVYNELHDVCSPSAFGRGEELVMDESYRTARELLPDRFALNFDPLKVSNGVLENVATMCMAPVVADLYKMNSYVKGGFFKPHKDTPKADNHIGTLLVGLPIPFTGGELVLRSEGNQSVTIDWSNATGFSWVFFYSDVEHEILPVTSGHRLTISYDVFTSGAQVVPTILEHDRLNLDLRLFPLSRQIEAQVLQNAAFLPDGGRLAFRLIHEYPLSNKSWTDNFSRALKGMDALLHQIFFEKGLKVTLTAVYRVPIISDALFGYKQYRKEIVEGCDKFTARDKSRNRTLFTCSSFKGLKGQVDLDDTDAYPNAIRRQLGGKEEMDLIWCTKPKNYVQASTYVACGNQPEEAHTYVSAAMIVEVPKN